MTSLTFASLRAQRRRLLAPGLAVAVGVMFVAATLSLGTTLTASTRALSASDIGRFAAVVTAPDADPTSRGPVGEPALSAAQRALVAGHPDVAEVHALRIAPSSLGPETNGGFGLVASLPDPGRPISVTAGRLPAAPGEIAVNAPVASSYGLRVGATTQLTRLDGTARPAVPVTVVGIVDTGKDRRAGAYAPWVYASDADLVRLLGADVYNEFDVLARPGVDPAALATTLAAALGGSAQVRTGESIAAQSARDATGASETQLMLLTFAAIALFVSALVIANTFTILLARRARESALLRAVGATRGQLARSALLEAVALGAVASVVGAAGGAAFTWLVTRLAADRIDVPLSTWQVAPADLIVPVVVGVTVTVLASALPVRNASRISPVAALHSAPDSPVSARVGRLRMGAGFLLLALGVGLLALGASGGGIGAGIPGGMLSFLGVLLAGSVLIPAAIRALGGGLGRWGGAPGQLALENAVRNPRRTAATASALLVGITLIAMMMVGSATARASIDTALTEELALDLTAHAGRPLPASAVAATAATRSVTAVAAVRATEVTGPGKLQDKVAGIPAEALGVVRSPKAMASNVVGTVTMTKPAAAEWGVSTGDSLRLTGPSGAKTFTVRVDGALGYSLSVPEVDLMALDRQAEVYSVMLRLADDADVPAVVNDLRAALSGYRVTIAGAAPIRAEIDTALQVVLWIVTGLLAVSVLIAVVGVANTLSLSVLERTRESALLRALGLTRGQLRGMLAAEAALLALVASVLGIGLGVLYGVTGMQSLFTMGRARVQVSPQVPWDQLAAVALVAVTAGLLASVLPARRAARVAPAAALAVE